jgi:hypothetical protein
VTEDGKGSYRSPYNPNRPRRRTRISSNRFLMGVAKLFLCLLVIAGIVIIAWTGYRLFTHQIAPVIGTIVFLTEIGLLIWVISVLRSSRFRWRSPSFKLVFWPLVGVLLVCAFAGVEPMSTYKDTALSKMQSAFSGISNSNQQEPINPNPPVTQTPDSNQSADVHTGVYKNYYLGLVDTPEGTLSGNGCYGEFIVLINNKDAVNPTYNQLVNFLQQDKTDQFPYQYTVTVTGMYYGTAESNIDLTRIKNIIDGTAQPNPPQICADFAERLHNNAELAGIRCAYVDVTLVGYTDPYHYGIPSNTGHALNAFETIDMGLVYIDDTNAPGPTRCVTIVNVQMGQQYIPVSLFPEPGWNSTWDSMGTVTDIFITWDGNWNN